MPEKVMAAEEAVALIRDGDTLGLQAGPTQCAPMALVRALLRTGRRDLHVVSLSGGMALDWLAARAMISRATFAAVTMEAHGMCTRFRRAVEAGAVAAEELSETALLARLGAGARGLPYLPVRGMLGTDLLNVGNPALAVVDDPFGGPPVVACRALRCDVALLHAHRADARGNVALDPGPRHPMTTLLPRACDRVIVSVEEIVTTDSLRARPEQTFLPEFVVDAVVEAPFGAHPTSLFPRYDHDAPEFAAWTGASAEAASAAAYLAHRVDEPASHEAYLGLVGADRLAALARGPAR